MPTNLRAVTAVIAAVALAPNLAEAQARPSPRPAGAAGAAPAGGPAPRAPASAAARPAAPATAAPPVKRIIYRLETLQTTDLTPEVITKLKPLNTLAECEAVLKAADMPFTWAKAEYDSDVIGPAFVRQLEALPPNEVFIVPRQGGGTLIGVIIGRR